MMQGSAGDAEEVCSACGARCAREATTCWLCGAQFDAPAPASVSPGAAPRGVSPWIEDESATDAGLKGAAFAAAARVDDALRGAIKIPQKTNAPNVAASAQTSFSLSTLLLAVTLVTVGCGLLVAAPGLGIPACILLAPVLVRTSMVVRRRKDKGGHVSAGEKFALIASSFVVACVILTVVAVAAVGTFCAVCIGLASASGRGGGDGSAVFAAGLAALAVVIYLGWVMQKWVRNRYRRDIGDD